MAFLLTSISFNFSLFMDRDELGQVAILTEQAIQSHARLMNPTLKGSVSWNMFTPSLYLVHTLKILPWLQRSVNGVRAHMNR